MNIQQLLEKKRVQVEKVFDRNFLKAMEKVFGSNNPAIRNVKFNVFGEIEIVYKAKDEGTIVFRRETLKSYEVRLCFGKNPSESLRKYYQTWTARFGQSFPKYRKFLKIVLSLHYNMCRRVRADNDIQKDVYRLNRIVMKRT